MNNFHYFLTFLITILIFTSNSFSGNIKIGLNVGTSNLKYKNSDRAYIITEDYYKSISHNSTYAPKTISPHISYGFFDVFEIRGTFNLCKSLSIKEYDKPEKTIVYNTPDGIIEENHYEKYYQKTETAFQGYSSGIDLLYFFKDKENSGISVYTGISIKYYDIQNEGEWEMIDPVNIDGEVKHISSKGRFNTVYFNGFGQEFILGLEFNHWNKFSVNLEVSKLGFNNINVEKKYDYVKFEETSENYYSEVFREKLETLTVSYQEESGLSDIGIFLDINFKIK